jgi:hypothetical protein
VSVGAISTTRWWRHPPASFFRSAAPSANYKKASDADVIDNDGTWQRLHDDSDWGPLMDEIVSGEDDPDEHDNPDTDDANDDE